MKPKLRSVLCALCVLCGSIFFATGCGTIGDQPLLAQVAVQYATIKVVQNHPERAARIVTIAHALRATASGEAAASVAILEAFVRGQVKWENLDSADTLLVDTLISGISAELTARLGAGVLDPAQRLVVAQVAGWIEAAASAAVPPLRAVGPPGPEAAPPPPAVSTSANRQSPIANLQLARFSRAMGSQTG